MKLKVLIPCAGVSLRWNNHLGLPKQLAPLPDKGATILGRTVRLLQEFGVEQIHVITHDEEIKAGIQGVSILYPSSRKHLTDSILSAKSLWQGKTIVLLGDVVFSRRAVETILNDRNALRFYGTLEESPVVQIFGLRREIFGFSFDQ